MQCRGDNNYKQAHNQGEKRQKSTGTAVDLSVNYEGYIACKDVLAMWCMYLEIDTMFDLML